MLSLGDRSPAARPDVRPRAGCDVKTAARWQASEYRKPTHPSALLPVCLLACRFACFACLFACYANNFRPPYTLFASPRPRSVPTFLPITIIFNDTIIFILIAFFLLYRLLIKKKTKQQVISSLTSKEFSNLTYFSYIFRFDGTSYSIPNLNNQ